ncbi:Serine/threonine-protein kinase AFC2 [Capsicum annuum]|nr:Serine/threonine-protein kinase AFC2 [Capsicum annuum]
MNEKELHEEEEKREENILESELKNYVHLHASVGWNSLVAFKIVRGMEKYRDAAMIEVFEKLGSSLYDFLRKNNYRSFPIDLVREIERQLLDYVAFMHDLRLIHTDLKPENIFLTSPEYVKVPDYKVSSRSPKDGSYYKRIPKSSVIKVIDFGSTTYDRLNQTYVVSTRHYLAPEVILEYDRSDAIRNDMAAIGVALMDKS